MKGWKRFLSLLLGLCMLFQTIGMTAVAAKEEEPEEYTTTISHKQQSGEISLNLPMANGRPGMIHIRGQNQSILQNREIHIMR